MVTNRVDWGWRVADGRGSDEELSSCEQSEMDGAGLLTGTVSEAAN